MAGPNYAESSSNESHGRQWRHSWPGPQEPAPQRSADAAQRRPSRRPLRCGSRGRSTAMAGMWTARRSAQICMRLAGRRFFGERREGQSQHSRIWNSRGRRRGRLWPMMPRPRTCRQPMPWSLALSRCRPSTASRAALSTGGLVTASGSVPVTVLSWKCRRSACVRAPGLVSRSARSRRRGTSPCSKRAAQRGKRTCASPGIACPASLIGSRRADWTTPSRGIWLILAAAGFCQRTNRPGACAYTTGWAHPTACSLPSVTRRPAAGSQGREGRSARSRDQANVTDRKIPRHAPRAGSSAGRP